MAAAVGRMCLFSSKQKSYLLSNLCGLKFYSQLGKENTHFGFEAVSPEEKTRKVQTVFSNVASKYDLMNDVMSLGIHRLWKDKFIEMLHPVPGTTLIDVAGGTGDIAFRFLNFVESYPSGKTLENRLNSNNPSHVTVCDLNIDMLRIGKERGEKLGLNNKISWVHSNAEKLPFADSSFDAYTVSFGFRNVTYIHKALKEAYRVLRHGGQFVCLEFSHVQSDLVSTAYDWYLFEILPVMGQVLARDWRSYQYLSESIIKFPDQEDFKRMIECSGFQRVSYTNLSSGIACIHSGFKL